ncbi:MAG: hypothetical protein RL329_2802 [Bacteroidota bacterium]
MKLLGYNSIHMGLFFNHSKTLMLMQFRNTPVHLFFCLLVCNLFFTHMTAQIQLNVGYGVLKTKPISFNQIIETYNQSFGNQLVTAMKPLNSLEGIHGEVAFSEEFFSIGFEWQNLTRDLKNQVKNGAIEEIHTLHYANDMLSLHAGMMFMRNFGVGITGDYNIIQAKKNVSTNKDVSTSLLSTNQWSSRFYLHFNIPLDDYMAIAIRPYVRTPWNSIDYAPVKNQLGLAASDNGRSQDKKIDFGIQLILQSFLSPRPESDY